MNKQIPSVLILFCLLINGFVYAEGDMTAQEPTVCVAETFICPDGTTVSREGTNCEFAPCPIAPALATDNPTTTQETENITLNKPDCQEQIRLIDEQIRDTKQEYLAIFKSKLSEFITVKTEYHVALKAYQACMFGKISGQQNIPSTNNNSHSNSTVTGNVVAANAIEQKWIQNNISVASVAQTTTAPQTTETETTDDISIEELEKDVPEIPETTNTNCQTERAVAAEKLELAKNKLMELREIKDRYKSEITTAQNLKSNKQEIIRICYPQMPAMIGADCQVPIELLDKEKELYEKIIILQNQFTSAGNTKKKEDFISQYKEIKTEYLTVTEKIKTLKLDCQQRERVVANLNNCTTASDSLTKIEELKNQLITETNEDQIYKLKRKIEYYQQKIEINCLSVATESTETSTEPIEIQKYKAQIQELKSQLDVQNQEIIRLKSEIDNIKAQLKNTNQKKEDVLENNADKILEHTKTIIDKRITNLKESIAKTETSTEIPETEKAKIIDRLNEKIANLELINSKLTNASTPQELRQQINDARSAEENSILENKISSLSVSLKKLNDILGTYFTDTEDYNSYKTGLDEISRKVLAINSKTTKEEVSEIIQEYKTLKKRIIKSAEKIGSGVDN